MRSPSADSGLTSTRIFFPDENLYTRHEIVRPSRRHASTAHIRNTTRIVHKPHLACVTHAHTRHYCILTAERTAGATAFVRENIFGVCLSIERGLVKNCKQIITRLDTRMYTPTDGNRLTWRAAPEPVFNLPARANRGGRARRPGIPVRARNTPEAKGLAARTGLENRQGVMPPPGGA